jgi:predicted HTH domain antitoxin
MATLQIEVPDDQVQALGANSHEAAQAIRLAAAFHLCSRGQISTAKAARLAGMSYTSFLEEAARRQVDLYQYDPEEVKEEIGRPLPANVDLDAIKREIDRAQSPGS